MRFHFVISRSLYHCIIVVENVRIPNWLRSSESDHREPRYPGERFEKVEKVLRMW